MIEKGMEAHKPFHPTLPPISDSDADVIRPNAEAYAKTLLGQIDRRFLSKPSAKVALGVLLCAAVIVPCVQFVHSIQETDAAPFRASGEQHRTALGRWIPTAELIAADRLHADPYGYGHWFPLPPLVLLAITPLASLGYFGAGVAFALAKVVGSAAALAAFVRNLGRSGWVVPVGVLAMAMLFGLRPIVSDIQHGNVNIFVLVWLAACWACYAAKQDFLAGAFLGLAVVTKITPGLLVVYFLYKREWRVGLAAIAACGLGFFVLPGAYLGFAHNWELLKEWFEMLVMPYLLEGYAIINTDNQSLYSILVRLLDAGGVIELHPMPAQDALIAGSDVMAKPPHAALFRPLISVPILGTLAWLCWGRARDRGDLRVLLEFSLVLLAMLLLSERTWKHHATTLILVFTAVWLAVACAPWRGGVRTFLVAGLAAQWILLVGTSEGLLGDDLANLIAFNGGFGWGLLLAFVEVAAIAWMMKTPAKWMRSGACA
jgi:hypothetical protein